MLVEAVDQQTDKVAPEASEEDLCEFMGQIIDRTSRSYSHVC